MRYWAGVRQRASEFFPGRAVQAGVDFVLSEVVHCKSAREEGVPAAFETCIDRYLDRLVSASAARVVVFLGRWARAAAERVYGDALGAHLDGPRIIGGRPRVLVFLPHPNARTERSAIRILTPEELEMAQGALADARH